MDELSYRDASSHHVQVRSRMHRMFTFQFPARQSLRLQLASECVDADDHKRLYHAINPKIQITNALDDGSHDLWRHSSVKTANANSLGTKHCLIMKISNDEIQNVQIQR